MSPVELHGSIDRFVSRAAWGARPATSITLRDLRVIRTYIVHYSGMDADEQAEHRNCAGRVRAIQRYHMTSDQLVEGGASDIGYTWLVCKHGYTFQGRGIRRVPAATRGANTESVAVCFLGDDSVNRDDVTVHGRLALRDVLEFTRRNARNLNAVRGHRDFAKTRCPGDQLYGWARRLDREFFPRA